MDELGARVRRQGPVLVTGAAGFVGEALVRQLTRQGATVWGATHRGGLPLSVTHPRVTGVAIDLPDLEPLRSMPAPAVVYHLAATVDPSRYRDPARCEQVNVVGSAALGRWALQRGSRLVMVSSMAAMGIYDAPGGVDEASPCQPTTVYGKSKLAAERALAALQPEGLALTIVRPPTLYGPADRYNFLALTRAIARRQFVLFGGGANRFGIMHVDNLVTALLTLGGALGGGGHDGLFLAEDGEEPTLAEVARRISLGLGRSGWIPRLPLWTGRLAAAAIEPACAALGIEPPLGRARLRTLTVDFGARIGRLRRAGYSPTIGMGRAITATIAGYRDRGLLERARAHGWAQ